jgi:membrane protease YdiL (CAAX protease family)
MENPHAPVRDWSALAFASFFPLVMTTIYFVVLHNPDGEPNPVLIAAFWSGKFFQFIFPAAYVYWFERESIRFVGPSWRGIAFGIGFGLTVGISMFALYFHWVQHIPSVADNSPRMIYERLVQFKATTPLRYLALAFYICVPHSLGEEYYWRWFVFGWMRRYVPLSVAITLSSIAFMLHHVVILDAGAAVLDLRGGRRRRVGLAVPARRLALCAVAQPCLDRRRHHELGILDVVGLLEVTGW